MYKRCKFPFDSGRVDNGLVFKQHLGVQLKGHTVVKLIFMAQQD